MKYSVSVLIILSLLAVGSSSQERTVVATVDSTPIYLDEIGGSEVAQQDEIKFVEPDLNPDHSDLKSRIILLRKRISDQLLLIETEKRSISPSEELVTREVNAYAAKQWQLLFPTPEKKKEVLSRMQLTGLKILEGLTIWREDKEKGDEFADKELKPLGMTPEAWSFYTANSNDTEILSKLKKWEEVDSMTDSEIREFLFLTKNKEHRDNIRSILAKDMLKREVTGEASVTIEEAQILHDLIYNTEWIDIIIIPEDDPELQKLISTPMKERSSSLPDRLKSKVLRLPNQESKNAPPHRTGLKEYMVLASSAESLEPGTLSGLIEWPRKTDKSDSFFIFIEDIKANSEPVESDGQTEAELSQTLLKFKRDREFDKWLDKEISQRAKILIPEYQEAIRN